MKIKKDILREFLEKINMQGNEQVNEAIFDFTENGLKVSAMTPSKVVRVDGVLKNNGFIDYEVVGKVGVQDISTLIKIIKKFNDEIEIKIEQNLIHIVDGNKNMTTELVDIQFIKATAELKQFEFADMFTIDVDKLHGVIEDASINGEYNINFKTVEKGVSVNTTGKYKFNRNIVVEEAKGGADVTFGKPFVNAIANLTNKIEMNIKSNFPTKILERTEVSVISLIISPVVKN